MERLTARRNLQRTVRERGPITIRLDRDGDTAELARLANLSGVSLPAGPFLLAEAETVLAAVGANGATLADPFERTDDLVALLRLRRRQLDGAR